MDPERPVPSVTEPHRLSDTGNTDRNDVRNGDRTDVSLRTPAETDGLPDAPARTIRYEVGTAVSKTERTYTPASRPSLTASDRTRASAVPYGQGRIRPYRTGFVHPRIAPLRSDMSGDPPVRTGTFPSAGVTNAYATSQVRAHGTAGRFPEPDTHISMALEPDAPSARIARMERTEQVRET